MTEQIAIFSFVTMFIFALIALGRYFGQMLARLISGDWWGW